MKNMNVLTGLLASRFARHLANQASSILARPIYSSAGMRLKWKNLLIRVSNHQAFHASNHTGKSGG